MSRRIRHSHPQVAYRFLTYMSTETLLEAVLGGAFRTREERTLAAMMIIEVAYRCRVRDPRVPAIIWNEVHRGKVKPPPGLMSPSQAWPTERHWAVH